MQQDKQEIKSVLFDLDGTLADTSSDMCDSLNRFYQIEGLNQLTVQILKLIYPEVQLA